jgi:hypothetical protein
MLKNLSFLAIAGALTAVSMTGCLSIDTTDLGDDAGDGDGDTTGDGDGDTGDGDGDTGDGDGDTGDGDGDTGDGDGDTGDGDGDGDPAGMCGWDAANMYYECGFEGADPSGTLPLECPDGLVEGDPCGTVTGAGCCDANGDNWYCGDDQMGGTLLVLNACG